MNRNSFEIIRINLLCFFFLISMGISTVSCSKYSTSKESIAYLEHPKRGDLYFLEQEKEVFSLIEIKSISEESIDFSIYKGKTKPSQFVDETYGFIKFVRTEESKNYGGVWVDSTITFKKDTIKTLYDTKVIYEIKRY